MKTKIAIVNKFNSLQQKIWGVGMNLKSRLKVIAITVFVIFAFPQKVKASELHAVHYWSYNEQTGEEFLLRDEFEFYGNFSREEKALVLFSNLFAGTEKYSFVPKGIKILNIFILENCLYLNVSSDIKSYGGGTSYETRLKMQIIKTAINITDIDSVTLMIDGIADYLPEGSLIFKESALPQL